MTSFSPSSCRAVAALALVGGGARSDLAVSLIDAGPLEAGLSDAGLTCIHALSPSFTPTGPVGFACAFDPAAGAAPAFASVVGVTLFEASLGNGPQPVFQFFADVPALAATAESGESSVNSSGAFYGAVHWATYPDGANPSNPTVARVEVIIRSWTTHQTVFHDAFDTPYESSGNPLDAGVAIRGNDAGVFAYGYGFGSLGATEVVAVADGQQAERSGLFQGVVPMGDPDAQGVVPAANADTSSGSLTSLWLDPCSGTTPYPAGVDAFIGSRILTLDTTSGSLVLASAHSAQVLALPPPATGWRIFDVHDSDWILLYAGGSQFLAANLATSALVPIAVNVPMGLSRLAWFTQNPFYDESLGEVAITSDGSLLMPLRDAQAAHLYRLGQDGSWTALGDPLGGLLSVQGLEAGGTYLGFSSAYAVSPPTGWPPPTGGRIDGTSVELMRPLSAVTQLLEQDGMNDWEHTGYALDADGGCLSFWAGTVLHVVRTTTGGGSSFDLDAAAGPEAYLATAPAWYAAPTLPLVPH